jgi:mTERF
VEEKQPAGAPARRQGRGRPPRTSPSGPAPQKPAKTTFTPVDAQTLDFLQQNGVWQQRLTHGDRRDAIQRRLRQAAPKQTKRGGQTNWPCATARALYAWLADVTRRDGWPSTLPVKRPGRETVHTPVVSFLVEKEPQLLLHDFTEIRARWSLLHAGQILGLSRKQAIKVIAARPSLLWTPPGEQLRERVHFLQSLGVADIAGCVARFPSVLTRPAEKIQASVRLLARYGLPAGNLLQRSPHLLAFSIPLLEQKLEFWLHEMQLPRTTLQRQPQLIRLAVETRLKPRAAQLRQLGVSMEMTHPRGRLAKGAPRQVPGLLTLLRSPQHVYESILARIRSSSPLRSADA